MRFFQMSNEMMANVKGKIRLRFLGLNTYGAE